MFGLGFWEVVIIAVIALIVLGPGRLPTAAKQLGRAVREFQRAAQDLRVSIEDAAEPERVKPTLRPAAHLDEAATATATAKSDAENSAEPPKGKEGDVA